MSCCAPGAELCYGEVGTLNEKLMLFSWMQRDGRRQSDLLCPTSLIVAAGGKD